MYINRIIEKEILKASKEYPVIMVCGQRQVGKTTMLNHIKEPNRKYVPLDDRYARKLAHEV
jgi:predicted AAA+ superfamily ATPase